MAEIKKTFTGGRMEKDLDERLVPNGLYRDALNIEVRTTTENYSDEGDAGTVQNLRGNLSIATVIDSSNTNATCIASVADEKNDKAYFFFTHGGSSSSNSGVTINNATYYIDNIAELDAISNTIRPVVTDVWQILETFTVMMGDTPTIPSTTSDWNQITVSNGSKYRVGMTMSILSSTNVNLTPNAVVKEINGNVITLTDFQNVDITNATNVRWLHTRMLNFEKNNIITGINIIDKYLFWTDSIYEPKKINIPRCKQGTPEFTTHSKLRLNHPVNYGEFSTPSILENDTSVNDDLLEEHITVIKKAPKTPPTIHFSEVSTDQEITIEVTFVDVAFSMNQGGLPGSYVDANVDSGNQLIINSEDLETSGYSPNQVLTFTSQSNSALIIKTKFITYLTIDPSVSTVNLSNTNAFSQVNDTTYLVSTTSPTSKAKIEVVEILGNYIPTDEDSEWTVSVDTEDFKPLFELKFPRFGYRYRYNDGEYSSFSPWSEIAFVPKDYTYDVKQGFNLGMVNGVKELKIKDFVPNNTVRSLEVDSVDILLKTTDSPQCYVIKTVTRGRDPEWDQFTSDNQTGELTITSNMLHSAIADDQKLRAWDNVPLTAKAQEIIASRLVYANYTQGYDIKYAPSLYTIISSQNNATQSTPQKSIKTLRNYKFGVVFGDKYGRETPVLDSFIFSGSELAGFKVTTGDVVSEKQLSKYSNSFSITQNWEGLNSNADSQPESWMDYAKYYIKETSSEYYNLVMDRWYYAKEEDNIWLSFPSSDRNKVDEETYLILKKDHGLKTPVVEKARYKIIAIENEAPDFIKIDRRTLVTITLDDNDVLTDVNTQTTQDNEPNNLIFGTDIQISTTQLELLGFGESPEPDLVKDLKFKIIAENTDGVILDSMPFVAINSLGAGSSADSIALAYENPLDQAVNYHAQFIARGDTTAGGIEYRLKIVRDVIENRPEFDGRFFVLIEKDEAINKHVAKLTNATVGFQDKFTWKLHYIANAATNPSDGEPGEGNEDYTNYQWEGFGTFREGTGNNNRARVHHMARGSADSNNQQANPVNAQDETRQFWQAARDGMQDQRIFIDEAQSTRLIFENEYNPNENAIFQGGMFKPTGLDQGGADEGTLGRMMISNQTKAAGFYNDPPGFPESNNFFEDFETDTGEAGYGELGTNAVLAAIYDTINGSDLFFRFNNDPNNDIYKVLVVDPVTGQSVRFRQTKMGTNTNYHSGGWGGFDVYTSTYTMPYPDTGETEPGTYTFGTTGGNDFYFPGTSYSNRNSVRFEFRRVDTETGAVTSEGIRPDVYDPRATLKHDGMSSIDITFMSRDVISGDIIRPPEERAVWETEPKQDVDLDIYYEASHAIPMTLQKENILNFAPLNSTVTISRELNKGIVFNPSINIIPDGLPFSEYTVDRAFVKSVENMQANGTGPIVRVQSLDVNGDGVDQAFSIGVGDLMQFSHYNGTTTSSRILNFRNSDGSLVSGKQRTLQLADQDENQPITNQVILGTVSGNTEGEGGTELLNNQATFEIDSGMQVSGFASEIGVGGGFNIVNIPNGVFIYNYEGDVNNMRLTDTSWMTPGALYVVRIHKATGYYEIDREVWKYPVKLGWFNCYSFGNGVESDRIRDDFNAPQLDNGVKVSSTFLNYRKEDRTSGLIYSGLYNSNTGVNRLNEFNMSQKITKDLNPAYGSIQALKTRDLDLVTFLEDRVLKILANKDAVFNADGNPQLTATDRVLGQAIPFVGDYGISKNPESLASDQYRLYFTDSQRGAVLRLSRDGLTPISNVGMKTWFRNNISSAPDRLFGNFDKVKGEYNLTVGYADTVSFNEAAKGWVSFKSFKPDHAVSITGKYYTVFQNQIYEHHQSGSVDRNTFYGTYTSSKITILYNDIPNMSKSFKSLNYEGTRARVIENTDSRDDNYYNLVGKDGWYVNSISTDLEAGSIDEFIKKESKYYNRIKGVDSYQLDAADFTVQGIGFPVQLIANISSSDTNNNSNSTGDDLNNSTSIGPTPQALIIRNDPND